MKTIVIVMPTYNERENVSRMIEELVVGVFPKIKNYKMVLEVVDDHSPDGTWKVVLEKSKKYKNVFLNDSLKKRGLGGAYTDGFNCAIKELKADAVMEMDADFQHDPNDVPRFITELDKGYDYIIGSRYVEGGSIPREWTIDRKFLSVVGNLIYQTTLFIGDVHDFTTGFRLARVKGFLDRMDFAKIFSKSFAYKTRLLYEMRKRKARVKEIPIVFKTRELGDSKMTTNSFTEALRVIAIIWADRLGLNE